MSRDIKIDPSILDRMVKDLQDGYLNSIAEVNLIVGNKEDIMNLYEAYSYMFKWYDLANKAMEYQFDPDNIVDYSNNFEKYNQFACDYRVNINNQLEMLAAKYGFELKNKQHRQK